MEDSGVGQRNKFTNQHKRTNSRARPKDYSSFKPERQFEKAKNYTMWAVSRSARTENEIRTKLMAKKCAPEIIDATIQWAEEYNFINDNEYVEMFITQHVGSYGKTLKWAEMKLKHKGIKQNTLEQVKVKLQTTNIFSEEKVEENAERFGETTLRRLRTETDTYKKKKKFTDRMLRAGYDYSTIQKTWNTLNNNE